MQEAIRKKKIKIVCWNCGRIYKIGESFKITRKFVYSILRNLRCPFCKKYRKDDPIFKIGGL